MKAIVAYGAKDYRFCEVDTPKVGEGEILIKIEAAGICASDRAVYMGGAPWGGIESESTRTRIRGNSRRNRPRGGGKRLCPRRPGYGGVHNAVRKVLLLQEGPLSSLR